jgi:hypothetical protein
LDVKRHSDSMVNTRYDTAATRLNTPPLQRPISLVSPLLPPASLAPSPHCLNHS